MPSEVPTISPAPTISPQPSPAPSSRPTPAPTTSLFPTLHPTDRPTTSPSSYPTVSFQPTISAVPTVFSGEFALVQEVDSDGNALLLAECNGANIPVEASPLTEQLVEFQYEMYTKTNPIAALQKIERVLQSRLQWQLLDDCQFQSPKTTTSRAIQFLSMSSAPVDYLAGNCPRKDNDDDDVHCFIIQAGFTTQVFYLLKNRRLLQLLQSEISDQVLVESLGEVLGDLFAGQALYRDYVNGIVRLNFTGFTNVALQEALPDNDMTNSTNNDTGDVSRATQPGDQDSRKGPIVASSLALTVTVLALIVVVLLVAKRRRRRHRKGHHNNNTTSSDLEDTRSWHHEDESIEGNRTFRSSRTIGDEIFTYPDGDVSVQPKSDSKFYTYPDGDISVHNGGISYRDEHVSLGHEDEDFYSYAASFPDDASSFVTGSMLSAAPAYVVDEDDNVDVSTVNLGPSHVSGTRVVEDDDEGPQPPTFLPADRSLDRSSRELDRTMRDLDRSMREFERSSPRMRYGERHYSTNDTVVL